jgi:hypothetical protein
MRRQSSFTMATNFTLLSQRLIQDNKPMSSAIPLLPESDIDYLNLKEFKCEIRMHGADIHLIIDDFELPPAYAPRICRLLLKLPSGYPEPQTWTIRFRAHSVRGRRATRLRESIIY